MTRPRDRAFVVPAIILLAVLAGCAAGDARFTPEDPAGFWLGLWHGIIALITLVIGIFSDAVQVYERNNTGGWYDFGFLLGIVMMCGCGHKASPAGRRSPRLDDAQCEAIGQKFEAKARRKIREWAEAEPDEDWNVVEAKAEAKLKRKIREWAEEE